MRFSGRVSRVEYWAFVLKVFFLVAVAGLVEFAVGWAQAVATGPLTGVVFLLALVPGIAMAVRRLHDTGKSGWYLLLGLVPFGVLALLVFMFEDGDPSSNRYGPG